MIKLAVLVRIVLYNLICINVLIRLKPNTRHLKLKILFYEINGYVGVEGYDPFNEMGRARVVLYNFIRSHVLTRLEHI
jgi:hypothetical protein